MEEEILEQSSIFISKNTMLLAVAILLLINIVAFVLMGIDKRRSKHYSRKNNSKAAEKKSKRHRHKSRIPEAVLLTLAVCGGGFGILLGMIAFHHKTNSIRHPAFVNGVPIILLVELIFALFVFASMI